MDAESPSSSYSVAGEMLLRAPDGSIIQPTRVVGRGRRLYLLADQDMHEVDLADIVRS